MAKNDLVPFHLRTPSDQANVLLFRLSRLWQETGGEHIDFVNAFHYMCSDPFLRTEGYVLAVEKLEASSARSSGEPFKPGEKNALLVRTVIEAGCAYIARSRRATGPLAWVLVCEAAYFAALGRGYLAAKRAHSLAAAKGRHKDHHGMKVHVFNWLDANFQNHRSINAAAKAIDDGNEVKVGFDTVRLWTREWKKRKALRKP